MSFAQYVRDVVAFQLAYAARLVPGVGGPKDYSPLHDGLWGRTLSRAAREAALSEREAGMGSRRRRPIELNAAV